MDQEKVYVLWDKPPLIVKLYAHDRAKKSLQKKHKIVHNRKEDQSMESAVIDCKLKMIKQIRHERGPGVAAVLGVFHSCYSDAWYSSFVTVFIIVEFIDKLTSSSSSS